MSSLLCFQRVGLKAYTFSRAAGYAKHPGFIVKKSEFSQVCNLQVPITRFQVPLELEKWFSPYKMSTGMPLCVPYTYTSYHKLHR